MTVNSIPFLMVLSELSWLTHRRLCVDLHNRPSSTTDTISARSTSSAAALQSTLRISSSPSAGSAVTKPVRKRVFIAPISDDFKSMLAKTCSGHTQVLLMICGCNNGVSAGACRPGQQCDVPYGSDQFLCTDVNTQLSKTQLDKKCGGANSTKRVKVDRAWIAQELGKKTALSPDFVHKNVHFIKTGSGQMRKTHCKGRLCRGDQRLCEQLQRAGLD